MTKNVHSFTAVSNTVICIGYSYCGCTYKWMLFFVYIRNKREKVTMTERIHVMGSVTQNKGRKRSAEKFEMKHDHARVAINATACKKCLRLSLFSHILCSRLQDDYFLPVIFIRSCLQESFFFLFFDIVCVIRSPILFAQIVKNSSGLSLFSFD